MVDNKCMMKYNEIDPHEKRHPVKVIVGNLHFLIVRGLPANTVNRCSWTD